MIFGRRDNRLQSHFHYGSTLVFIFVLQIDFVQSWPTFRFSIPNGKYVPNPCQENDIWAAVGHKNPKVYADFNAFGTDFLRHGKTWNRHLCMTDSDGDGRTNGEELGDPTCEWQKSSPTPLLPAVSHPGICEPMDSTLCSQKPNQPVCAGRKRFDCPSIHRNDTQKLNVTMIRTHVPVKVLSYVCLEVRLPFDKDYHLLAGIPDIDQEKAVEQIQIFACDSGLHSRVYNHPFECGEKPRGDCQSLIGGFSKDEPGICFPPNTGYKIGTTGCRQIIFQIRYKNPFLNPALYDSSGMTLHYTSNHQQYELGTKLISVTHFTIPSGSQHTAITAEYPQQCSTTQITEQVFITGVFIHMHKFGQQQRLDLIRNGVQVKTIAESSGFKAHHLKGSHLESPIRILPGDSIRISCWYDTTSSNTPITWGLLSTNEMCSASLLFYPRINWLRATGTSFKKIALCKLQTSGEVNGCQFGQLFDAVRQTDGTTNDMAYCSSKKICTNNCSSIANLAFRHPCLNGENYELLQSRLTRKFQKLKSFLDTLQLCRNKVTKNATFAQVLTGTSDQIPRMPPIMKRFEANQGIHQQGSGYVESSNRQQIPRTPVKIQLVPTPDTFAGRLSHLSTSIPEYINLVTMPTSPMPTDNRVSRVSNSFSSQGFQSLPVYPHQVDPLSELASIVHSIANMSLIPRPVIP